jgi:hypothetical protein
MKIHSRIGYYDVAYRRGSTRKDFHVRSLINSMGLTKISPILASMDAEYASIGLNEEAVG